MRLWEARPSGQLTAAPAPSALASCVSWSLYMVSGHPSRPFVKLPVTLNCFAWASAVCTRRACVTIAVSVLSNS